MSGCFITFFVLSKVFPRTLIIHHCMDSFKWKLIKKNISEGSWVQELLHQNPLLSSAPCFRREGGSLHCWAKTESTICEKLISPSVSTLQLTPYGQSRQTHLARRKAQNETKQSVSGVSSMLCHLPDYKRNQFARNSWADSVLLFWVAAGKTGPHQFCLPKYSRNFH